MRVFSIQTLAWLAILTLILLVIFQSRTDRFGFPSCWGIQYRDYGLAKYSGPIGFPFILGNLEKEGFQNTQGGADINGIPLALDSQSGNPAKTPVKGGLLDDSLSMKQTPGTLSAKTCFQSDFLAQSNKVGNYIQRTNNIRHATPDSCSAPLTELVDSFYTNPILP
jgi:hypothetical protein